LGVGRGVNDPHPVKKSNCYGTKKKISRTDVLERPRHRNFHFATWNVLSLMEDLRISGWKGEARRRGEWKSVLRDDKVFQRA
jgi:hypothetical protein